MIENIKTEYVEYLHEDGLNPINQYVHIPDRNCPIKLVNINLLGNEAITGRAIFNEMKTFDESLIHITVTNR